MDVKERIRKARKSSGLSQHQLADSLGLSFMTIRRWESGEVSPRIDEIQKIAKTLNTSAEYLLGFSNNPNVIEPHQNISNVLTLADKAADEDIDLNEPVSAGMTDKHFIIKDWNTQQTYYFPNNDEGRKVFIEFTKRLLGIRTNNISNPTINGDNNSNNNLGVIQNQKGEYTCRKMSALHEGSI